MATPAVSIVPRDGRPRTQKIGAPERLGRNAARTVAHSQGHVWSATADTAEIRAHTETATAVDGRGDAIRAEIWRHTDAALAACLRGAIAEAVAELHAARGLRVLYEEAEAYEDDHRACTAAQAAGAAVHLSASARDHELLLSAGGGQ